MNKLLKQIKRLKMHIRKGEKLDRLGYDTGFVNEINKMILEMLMELKKKKRWKMKVEPKTNIENFIGSTKLYYVEIKGASNINETNSYIKMYNVLESDLEHIKRIFGKEYFITFKEF